MRRALVGLATAVLVGIIFVLRSGGIGALASDDGTGSYAFTQMQPNGGGPVSYSSCRSIPVEFNLHGLDDPEATRQILLQAMGQVSAASHLNLVYARDTARRPQANWGTLQGYPVLIAFADASEIPSMDRGVAGRGGSAWSNLNGRETYVSGQIVLERLYWNRELRAPGGKDETRAIVMHELGHVLGLAHVHDPGELMNADNIGRTELGPGDRRGLATLGKGPCS